MGKDVELVMQVGDLRRTQHTQWRTLSTDRCGGTNLAKCSCAKTRKKLGYEVRAERCRTFDEIGSGDVPQRSRDLREKNKDVKEKRTSKKRQVGTNKIR